ncbi:MAG: hypothetical protein L0Y71_01330 [Gemmataceae bacterium]|nr:hypothetical protein [Gemmataceae bacterium]
MFRALPLALAIFALASPMADAQPAEAQPAEAQRKPTLRLVGDQKHSLYMAFWPKSKDPWLNELKNKDVIFYNDSVMPAAYQDWDGGLQGLHSPSYNISAVRSEPIGNANREFPWGSPAGLHDSPNFKAFRFVSIPEGKSITWWRERLPRDSRGSFVWQYPAGTTFGEILLVTDPDGYDWTFELRTRTRTDKGWTMNAFRPFTTQAELAARIRQLEPKWRDAPELAKIVNGEAEHEETVRLTNNHDLITFDATALTTRLPKIDHALVRKLLDTPFKSALGQEWKKGSDGAEAFAPTTEAAFHIVPKNYKGGFVEVSSASCMRCHDSTLKHARDFQAFRDWYGRVRGSDNIFSFHIFEPGSISYNGFGNEPRLRQELVDAGLLEQWVE